MDECCKNHNELIESVKRNMPDDEVLYDIAELFRVFGDSTRVRILHVLFECETPVCAIADILNMTQSAISHQLRVLKQARLVKMRRDGKTIYYSLNDEHITKIFALAQEHVCE